jgi:NADPH-dependent ferric siderophore reductase
MTVLTPTVDAWRFFVTEVAAVTRLSPSFVRLTLTGPDLATFADNGWDQRFKLVLPDVRGSYDSLPRHADWYPAWRRLPDHQQNPVRTYTVRAVRPVEREVDVDLVLHGEGGPASRFARRATVGDPLVVLGPNGEYDDVHGGLEFRPPPGHLGPTLLVGDATATPAILSVLERLPDAAHGEAVLEVPHPGDILRIEPPLGVRVTWLIRRGPSSGLSSAVDTALRRLGIRPRGDGDVPVPEAVLGQTLWDVPENVWAGGLYAWIAGESSLVTGLRRQLVRDRDVDRRSVAFMGYWREGAPAG